MIFLTVGTQLPFDRMVRAVDAWAAASGVPVFAQIAEGGAYRPRHVEWVAHLDPAEFDSRFRAATAIVAHAGMGSIISALTAPKPILIVPRRADLGEHRNEHQRATADRFAGRPGLWIAREAAEIGPALDRLIDRAEGAAGAAPLSTEASPELVAALRAFILEGRR